MLVLDSCPQLGAAAQASLRSHVGATALNTLQALREGDLAGGVHGTAAHLSPCVNEALRLCTLL